MTKRANEIKEVMKIRPEFAFLIAIIVGTLAISITAMADLDTHLLAYLSFDKIESDIYNSE